VVGVLVVVALLAGLAIVLTRDGGDDTGDPTVAADTTEGEGDGDEGDGDPGPDPDALVDAGTHYDTIWGTPQPLASGVAESPVTVDEAEREVDCGRVLTCAATAVDDDVILAYPTVDGDGTTLDVERASAVDGTSVWGPVTVDTPPSAVALAWAGPNLLLATIEGEGDAAVRAYRGIDPASGEVLWTVTYSRGEGPIRASAQASQDVSVVMMTAVDPQGAAVGIDNRTGEELWRADGRVVHTDAEAAYLAVDGTVVAIELATGDERWTADVAVDEDGRSPAGRLGAVRDGVLVTVSGGEAVGLDVESGDEVWDERVPLSADGLDLGVVQAVAVAGGTVVVAARTGDVGISPSDGALVWREQRDPFIVPEETNLWIGTDDVLVVGQLGAVVRTIDPSDGAELLQVALSGGDGTALSSNAFTDGIVLLGAAGVTAFALDDLSELWTFPDFGEARTVTAVSGGVLVLGSGGITWLRALE
jgi:outer membrane protein assembly factor BamB